EPRPSRALKRRPEVVSISLHQVAERRAEVILGLLEGRVFGLALGSRLPRLRRNAEGASDASENGYALNSTLRPSRRCTLAERVIPCVRMTADLMRFVARVQNGGGSAS